MKLFVDNLWRYFEPKIEEKMRSSIRYYRAEVTANPGGNRLTVQRPFDTAVTIPCVDCMSDAKAGDQVLVMVFGGGVNGLNSVVVGDGALHALGGGKSPLPITNGGTGATTASEAVQNLFDVGSYATSYPTKPGIYRTIGTNIFQNMTPYSSYGVLMIFKAAYAAHFYIDATGTLYYGYSGDTFAEPTKWYTPSVTQKT